MYSVKVLFMMSSVSTHALTSKEAKRKILRIQNTKLGSVLIGMNKEGVVRADYKTKEVTHSLSHSLHASLSL